MYERDQLQQNAVLFSFALALADKAFKGIRTLEDLLAVRLPEGRDSWQLEWEENVLDLPVIRMASATGVTDRALTYQTMWSQLLRRASALDIDIL